ncbi:hypothetical protein [Desulfosporosinus fructosivorans]
MSWYDRKIHYLLAYQQANKYHLTLIRLKALGLLDNTSLENLKLEKIEKTATALLNAIKGNSDLCKSSEAKKIPAEYLEWVISNYYDKLIPRKSLETALDFVDLKADDFADPSEELNEDESFDFQDLFLLPQKDWD